jgi:hypothetical protein
MGRRPPEQARWALVQWPTGCLGCIPCDNVYTAVSRGAKFVADERDFLPWPAEIDPSQSNPRRQIDEHGA